ncbi:hypothetical protein BGW36DRAFT_401233 [Talaromyces proteolyticus]|uniref:Uncharacterized protein n=1 Tax=Talaromyces proteolyticus TaxID=1131652 RepID=A0AAD4PV59_9EURO|nr:uncharacterized protein BGW36DRAFT_401233 [Talaromyces proteolyticus]KAH8690909.1 hypothetical protein BGW36DRAFT_401233 [Talaromyces proteolyticus]
METTRLPYHSSCHCGLIKYVAFLSIPPVKFLHMSLPDAPNQFFLLSPPDHDELVNYQCFKPRWKRDEVDSEKLKMAISSEEGKLITIGSQDVKQSLPTGYFTVNALSIDQDQDHGLRLDLRQVVDNKWMEYSGCKENKADVCYDYPQEGGTW